MAEQKKRTTELDVDFSLSEMEEAEPVQDIKEVIEEELPEEVEGLDPRKKLIIIISSVVISIILAVVVYFVFIKADAPEVEQEVVEEVEEEEEIDEPEREVYQAPISYIVSPFLIPVADEGGNAIFLRVSVKLILSNEYVIKDLDKNITTLRQNLLYVFKTKSVASFQELEKKAVLKQEIITAANRVLQRGTIYEVYFIDFNVR